MTTTGAPSLATAAARLELGWSSGARSTVVVGKAACSAIEELWDGSWQDVALIADATVMALYGASLRAQLGRVARRVLCCDFPAGEAHKTRATKAELEDRLLSERLGRDGCIVALGGGVSLDLAGFVAATYLRGVATVYVPTSLLAQVDAALGGKTGVNTPLGKNLVGAFHHPRLVLVDPDFLGTLPLGEWRSGLAEIVKHAVVADAALFAWLEQHQAALAQPGSIDPFAVQRCIELKAALIQADEKDHGVRAALNFGHTVGHALEHASAHGYGHGQAVAIGMAIEGRLAHALCGFPADELSRLYALLASLGLPVAAPEVPFAELVRFLGTDKKRARGELRAALPRRLGVMAGATSDPTVGFAAEQLQRAWGQP